MLNVQLRPYTTNLRNYTQDRTTFGLYKFSPQELIVLSDLSPKLIEKISKLPREEVVKIINGKTRIDSRRYIKAKLEGREPLKQSNSHTKEECQDIIKKHKKQHEEIFGENSGGFKKPWYQIW